MPSAIAMDAPARTIGRYELRRLLGQGAQGGVWLAFDQRLDREVALKLLADAASDPQALAQWQREAHAVARLAHPGIVPLFEADVHAGRPYLVFELVQGRTLSQCLREEGAMPAAEAVRLILGVLDALAHAHRAGVIHRDLKPSNILIDQGGRARVMDFGIAISRRHGGMQGEIHGTPGYIAPELAQGAPPTPQCDVFAAGLVLYELLTGQRAVPVRDPWEAVRHVVDHDLAVPPDTLHPVDDALRAIVQRALARDVGLRYGSMDEMAQALQAWMTPADEAAPTDARHGTLDFLLRRMRHKSDFPAFGEAVARIRRIAASEDESLHALASEVLRDVALTNKLLRVVNSVHFRSAGAGSISTVSRAAALVGFTGIRNLVLSLVVLEHMQDKAHASSLKEEYLRSLLAGTLAGELSASQRDMEEAFIGASFQNLGRMLAQFYLPEEAEQVRRLVQPGRDGMPTGEAQAAVQVLGISYEELGLGVARSWGLPDTLQQCMRRPAAGAVPARAPTHTHERLRLLAAAANDAADVLLHAPAQEVAERVRTVGERYGRALGVEPRAWAAAVAHSRERLAETARAMGLKVAPGSRGARMLSAQALEEPPRAASAHPPVAQRDGQGHAVSTSRLPIGQPTAPADATVPTGAAPEPAADVAQPGLARNEHHGVQREVGVEAAQTLACGIQDISNALVEGAGLEEVLRMVLESMYRALGLQRVLFCLRDPRSGAITGRFGIGQQARELAPAFRIDLSAQAQDLFSLVCRQGADTLISDAAVGHTPQRLPAWFRERIQAPTFLLLPMSLRRAPVGLIYADQSRPGGIVVGERELALLRTLRNQAVMALQQARGG